MDLMEFQGKQLFARLGIPTTPPGVRCLTREEVRDAATSMPGKVVVKAQVRTGGRGKAGGIKVAATPDEAAAAASKILGLDIKGHIVRELWVEPASDIAAEHYLSVLTDRVGKGYLVICSAQGGMDIEQVNRDDPQAVLKEPVLPSELVGGLSRERALGIVERGRIPAESVEAAADFLVTLINAFVQADATLMEVNPLVRLTDGRLIALDAKVSLDGNALFRHADYAEFDTADATASPQVTAAKAKGIQYVQLEGEVGVIGNGAGLVMATLDVVAQAGGRAADFLDVGGGASAEKMADSLGVVLSDPQVRAVLVNIFGGITRGEEVANGVLGALQQIARPDDRIVVRLDGTNAEEGRRILEAAAHPNLVSATTMDEAARVAVDLAKQR